MALLTKSVPSLVNSVTTSNGTLKNFGAKIASNTVRVRDLGKRHKNG
ncbi:hypothetical protein [Geminocystis sp. NIES-3709]|nr:hypothetical protein [Geminocystis sp. NIES-3709]BAQ65931.1 hypothetical protein GM3709_2696 [Geminocystis sp. NIES-3709]